MSFGLSKENQSLSEMKAKADKLESYEKQLEVYIMRNALESDYFRKLNIEDVLGQIYPPSIERQPTDQNLLNKEDEKSELLSKLFVLDFASSRLRTIGVINLCHNLTVCDLSCNYIKKLNGLRNCHNLIKLDVHRNQIAELPTEEFWHGMENLTDLYLHNNAISAFSELKKMKVSNSLVNLTIYDTPISIKQHYRHFVVNSIWSLKCLDNVVISDEELIEDAKFGPKFQALQPHFFISQRYHQLKENLTLKEEMKKIQANFSLINKIQSKFCPVLIIQKNIRGYLARLKYQYVLDTRLWAAVTIQRFYREYRGLEYHDNNKPSSYEFPFLNLSSPRLDYETYIKYRKSLERNAWSEARLYVSAEDFPPKISRVFPSEANDGLPLVNKNRKTKMKLHINLKELAASTARIIEESHGSEPKNTIEKSYNAPKPKQIKTSTGVDKVDVKSLSKLTGINFVPLDQNQRKKGNKSVGNYPNKHEFLGRLFPDQKPENKILTNEQNNKEGNVSEEMEGFIAFRLSGTRPPKMAQDFLGDLTLKTLEIARDIRESMRDFERARANAPIRVVEKHCNFTNDKKLFIRTHGTMKLTCFRAVDQAYKDRDRAELLSSKYMRAREMKKHRERSKELMKQMKNLSLQNILSANAAAKAELNNILMENKRELFERQKTYVSDRATTRERSKQLREERKLLDEFVCQNNAVTEALATHELSSAKEKMVSRKSDKVSMTKTTTDQQKEVIKRFYEHRSLLLQSETAISRSKLDSQLNQRSKEQEEKAKGRVESLKKQKKKNRMDFGQTIGLAVVPPRLPPLAIVSEKRWGEWETTPKKEIKQRVHDRVGIWT